MEEVEEEEEYVRCRFGILPLDGLDEKSGDDVSGLSQFLLIDCLTNNGLTDGCIEKGCKLSLESSGNSDPLFIVDFSDTDDKESKVVVLESIGSQEV